MAEQAAHLVDAVLPWVPVRQWVLTVPHRLRYRLAFDHALCRAVLGVFVRAAPWCTIAHLLHNQGRIDAHADPYSHAAVQTTRED